MSKAEIIHLAIAYSGSINSIVYLVCFCIKIYLLIGCHFSGKKHNQTHCNSAALKEPKDDYDRT